MFYAQLQNTIVLLADQQKKRIAFLRKAALRTHTLNYAIVMVINMSIVASQVPDTLCPRHMYL